jgi:hypothetical protein
MVRRKAMEKQRRSKEQRFVTNVEPYGIFKRCQLPLPPQNSYCPQNFGYEYFAWITTRTKGQRHAGISVSHLLVELLM